MGNGHEKVNIAYSQCQGLFHCTLYLYLTLLRITSSIGFRCNISLAHRKSYRNSHTDVQCTLLVIFLVFSTSLCRTGLKQKRFY